MPVWGDHHVGVFLRYCLPFLLTEGNMGAFPGRRLQVHVTSTRADFVRMRQNENYRHLRHLTELIETEIDELIDLSAPYQAMTHCYLHVLRRLPLPERTVTFFPTPDCILSRNALRVMKQRIEAGWRAVMVCGLRLDLESVRPALDRLLARGADATSELELCQLALQHLHPIALHCDTASSEFWVGWPAHLYWIAQDRSWLLAHCFHLHPMAVLGIPKVIDTNTTIDGDYLSSLDVHPDQFYVCENSGEFVCLELSPSAKRINSRTGRLTPRHLSRFMALHSNSLHREFFARPILIRGSCEPAIPAEVMRQTAHLVGVVERGPNFADRCLGAVFSRIRGNPAMRRGARLVLRAARRLSAASRTAIEVVGTSPLTAAAGQCSACSHPCGARQ